MQALKISAARIPGWESDCALCGATAPSTLCSACERALPRLANACTQCAVPLPVAGLCGACHKRAPAFDAALAAFEYRFPVDRMVQRFKYGADLALGRWLAHRLAERAAEAPRPSLLVAPPLAAARMRERGFNQSVVLCAHIGKRLGVRHARAAFAKVRETAPQPELNRRERLANLRGSLRCEIALSGEHVAIVDDVMTTGATSHALARLLKANGAGTVSVWAVARAPDPARRG